MIMTGKYHDYLVCQGVTKNGKPCGARRRTTSLYCRDTHDPDIHTDYTDPNVLRKKSLRKMMYEVVKEHRLCQDPYRTVVLPDIIQSDLWLDHVVENHIITGCIDRVSMKKKDKDNIVFHLREECVNKESNLVVTTMKYNQLKYKACEKFFSDYKKEQIHTEGIFNYLQKEGQLSRQHSSNITHEILNSYEFIVDNLDIEKHYNLVDELHSCIVVGMKLK